MSEADSEPKFTRDTRVRIAVAKYHGLDGESWTREEIADYLNVKINTVDKYLNDSTLAQETEHSLVEKEAQTRLQLIQQLQSKLERLEEVEKQLGKVRETVPSQYELERDVQAKVDTSDIPNVQNPEEEQDVLIDVPVPSRYEEVPDVDRLKEVWREKRLVQEQLEDLLGLEAPDEIDVDKEQTIDVKYWRDDSDSLPEPDVVDVSANEIEDDLPEADE